MLRIIVGIALGTLTAFVVLFLIELLGHMAYPLPDDLDLRNPEASGQVVAAIPLPAKLVVILAWIAGTLVGGVVAKRICRRWWAAWPVAGLVACAAIVNVMMIPHPVWMQISAVLAPLLGALAASHLVAPRTHKPEAVDANL
jgi:hypothetical protein